MSDQEIAAAAWIVACAVLFLAITELPGSAARLTGRLTTAKGPSALLILIAIALVVRLAPTLLLRHANIFDLDSYRAVASVVEKGDDVYRSPVADRYPYFPLQLYVIVGADKLARFSGLPFELLIRLPVLAADVGVVALIWMARQRSVALKNRRECPAAAYAFNPVSTMVIAYGAQFDPIPLLLLLGAVITLLTMAGNRAVVFSAVLLGLAIADKTWPLLLLPLVAGLCRKPVRAVALSAVALSVPMAFAAIYSAWQGTPLDDLIRRPLEYKGVGGRWGFDAMVAQTTIRLPSLASAVKSASGSARELFVGGLAILYLQSFDWASVWRRFLLAFLTVFVSMSGFGLQYLSWVVPFALLFNARSGLSIFTVAATGGMLFMYHLEVFPAIRADFEINRAYQVALLPAWLVCVSWWLYELRPNAWRTSEALESASR